jgi:hypothetical protein
MKSWAIFWVSKLELPYQNFVILWEGESSEKGCHVFRELQIFVRLSLKEKEGRKEREDKRLGRGVSGTLCISYAMKPKKFTRWMRGEFIGWERPSWLGLAKALEKGPGWRVLDGVTTLHASFCTANKIHFYLTLFLRVDLHRLHHWPQLHHQGPHGSSANGSR